MPNDDAIWVHLPRRLSSSFWTEVVVRHFSSHPETIGTAVAYLKHMLCANNFIIVIYALNGVFECAGMTWKILVVGLVSYVIIDFSLPLIIGCTARGQPEFLWLSFGIVAAIGVRKRIRPVPGCLIFDQPTQTYYPPEVVQGGLEQIDKDSGKRGVQGLFELMKIACEEIEPNFQLIVLDYAHLKDEWFEDAIVEEWRGPKALVPYEWRAI